MFKVFQTKKGIGGNCFQACVASMLDVPLWAIPDLANMHEDGWWKKSQEWFRDIGIDAVVYAGRSDDVPLCIASYERDNGRFHAVVVQNNKIVHDPMDTNCAITFNEINKPTTEWFYLWFIEPSEYVEFVKDVEEKILNKCIARGSRNR